MEFCLFLWLSVGVALLWKHSFCKWYLKLKFESLEQFGLLQLQYMIQKVPWNHLQETGVRSITHPDQPYLCVSYAAHIFDFYNSRKYGNLNQSPNLYWPCQDETFCERWIQVVIMESFSHRDFAFMILLIISWLPPGCLCPSVLVVLRALSQHALPVIK